MTDRLQAMSVLLSVVDTGSLSAASRQLSIPLTTVSRKISDLEAHLGTRLFRRAGRGLVVTETGRAYAASCRRILEDVAEAERVASGELSVPKGNLVVTAPIVFGRLHVLPVLSEFLAEHPQIDVRMIQSDSIVDLPEDHVDVAVRIGRLPDSSLVSRRVGAIRRVVCASPAYLERRGTPQAPDELEDHDAITFENLMSARTWTFGAQDKPVAVRVRSRLIVNTAEAAIDAAVDGLGVTRVLSYQIASAVSRGRLVTVLEDFEDAPWPVSLVYPSRDLLPRKVRAFLDFAAPRLKKRLMAADIAS